MLRPVLASVGFQVLEIPHRQGKSLFFEVFIWVGYLFGIAGKIIAGNITYVFVFYVLNTLMVSVDILLYFRNRRLDQEAEKNA